MSNSFALLQPFQNECVDTVSAKLVISHDFRREFGAGAEVEETLMWLQTGCFHLQLLQNYILRFFVWG